MIPFTQFLMPDGRRKEITISRPPEIEQLAQDLINEGCRFEIEMLRTGEISMEILRNEDEVLACEICDNGPAVTESVDRMTKEAHAAMKGGTP